MVNQENETIIELKSISKRYGLGDAESYALHNFDLTVKRGETDTSGNYKTITANVGTLSIDPKKVTITANDASRVYNGQPLTESGFETSALETGDTHTFTVLMKESSTIRKIRFITTSSQKISGCPATPGSLGGCYPFQREWRLQ